MKIDDETKIFLQNRYNLKSHPHHTFTPNELRTERLDQLKKDNLLLPEMLNIENIQILGRNNQNIKLRFYFPKSYKKNIKNPVILFFHGGGFVMGNLDTHDFTCRSICIESEMIVIAVDYCLE